MDWITQIGSVEWTVYSLLALFITSAFLLIKYRMKIFNNTDNKKLEIEAEFHKKALDSITQANKELVGAVVSSGDKQIKAVEAAIVHLEKGFKHQTDKIHDLNKGQDAIKNKVDSIEVKIDEHILHADTNLIDKVYAHKTFAERHELEELKKKYEQINK